jgi:predicted transglutaminase-like cysteine proteinase
MKPLKAATAVNAFFVYKADKRDEHKILSPEKPAGDCEDYALSVAYYLAGRKKCRLLTGLIRGTYQLRQCRDPQGQPHYVLLHRNRYIDNQLKRWVGEKELKSLGYGKLRYIAGWVTAWKLARP